MHRSLLHRKNDVLGSPTVQSSDGRRRIRLTGAGALRLWTSIVQVDATATILNGELIREAPVSEHNILTNTASMYQALIAEPPRASAPYIQHHYYIILICQEAFRCCRLYWSSGTGVWPTPIEDPCMLHKLEQSMAGMRRTSQVRQRRWLPYASFLFLLLTSASVQGEETQACIP